MQRAFQTHHFRTGAFLIALVLLLFPVSGSSAASGKDWQVSISGLNGLVCVGDSYMLTARWNELTADSLASLTPPNSIDVTASLGSFDRTAEKPAASSGVAMFLYTAKDEGTETVNIYLYGPDSTLAAQNMVTFPVKTCRYRYNLFAKGIYTHQEITLTMTYKAEGATEPVNKNYPRVTKGFQKKFTSDVSYVRFDPKCSLSTLETTHGLGIMDVRTFELDDYNGVKLELGPPTDLVYTTSYVITCTDDEGHVSSNPYNNTIMVDISEDPWIVYDFPAGSGSYDIKIPQFDQLEQRWNEFGSSVYYATISLEREAGQ